MGRLRLLEGALPRGEHRVRRDGCLSGGLHSHRGRVVHWAVVLASVKDPLWLRGPVCLLGRHLRLPLALDAESRFVGNIVCSRRSLFHRHGLLGFRFVGLVLHVLVEDAAALADRHRVGDVRLGPLPGRHEGVDAGGHRQCDELLLHRGARDGPRVRLQLRGAHGAARVEGFRGVGAGREARVLARGRGEQQRLWGVAEPPPRCERERWCGLARGLA
mmetsp:Transcript_95076/g.266207  ORF Transcript_95076/g.266207 Transcript_95076/m.266207 type:complete len:217 (+) Transcript_95076:213-863(+)